MKKFLIKKIDRKLSDKDLEQLGFSRNYTEAMLLKGDFLKLKIFDLTVIQANILKQTALSKGCDCAVNMGCLNNSVEKSDAILFGTKSQLIDVAEKLKLQQFKMPDLSEEILSFINENSNITPKIMGILNITDDSFSDGGKFLDFNSAISYASKMIEDGADIIDIGAESTKPGAQPICDNIQIERIEPVLEKLVSMYPNVDFSVDTRSSEVAKKVLRIKNVIINDVSGLCYDAKMADVIVENNARVVICHSSSTPDKMQSKTNYNDIVDDILKFFEKQSNLLLSKNLPRENIVLDVGFGFGKTAEQNFELIKRHKEFLSLNYPLLVGISRKSFIQKATESEDYDFLSASLCGELLLNGASYFRVHNVKRAKEIIGLFSALL